MNRSNEDFSYGNMRPQMGATNMTLPITFDYSGGRREHSRSRKIWVVVLIVIGLLAGIGTLFNKEGFFLTNIVLGFGFMFLISLFIRFVILKEAKVRKEYIEMIDRDYKYPTDEIWGIYAVEDQYPYYCRFRNGNSGLFVRLNKDVILGKFSQAQFDHYEAISDALNIAGGSKVRICHIDYMDNVGTDERIEESFIGLSEVSNTDLKDVLTDIFTYQKEQMMERVTTFDVYAFLWTGSDIAAWAVIQKVLSCFLEANYRSYHILDSSDLRELECVLGNLHDFSVNDALTTAFHTNEEYKGVYPIKLIHEDGSEEKLGDTLEEKREKRMQAEKEKEAKREEIKRRKSTKGKKKKSSEEDEEINLF